VAKPPQARNSIKRALLYVAGVRFSEAYKEQCRIHFAEACSYCGTVIARASRQGHFDHAIAIASSSSRFHLVYACGRCNGDEKRERDWEGFLLEKCGGDDAAFRTRRQAILDWFATGPPALLDENVKRALKDAEALALSGFNQAVETLRLATLGIRLREARERCGLTQDQAADSIEASPTVIADIESGRRSLSTLELSTLAKLYGRPVADFFSDGQTREEATPASTMLASEAIDAYRRGEVSQGWLRDMSDELGMLADELIELAVAYE